MRAIEFLICPIAQNMFKPKIARFQSGKDNTNKMTAQCPDQLTALRVRYVAAVTAPTRKMPASMGQKPPKSCLNPNSSRCGGIHGIPSGSI